MKKVIVIGSSNTDMVVSVDHLPVPGETVSGGTFLMNQGGKGANQAIAVKRLGGQLVWVTSVGDDIFGQQSMQAFKKEGIDITYVHSYADSMSGVALINVDAHAENSIAVAPGANMLLKPNDVAKALDELVEGDYLLMQLEIPLETVRYAAKIAKQKGGNVVLNPAPATLLDPDLLDGLYLITPNKTEAELLTGIKIISEETVYQAAEALVQKGVQNVIITLGGHGCVVATKEQTFRSTAIPVKAVDTTAAGDTFNGALCVALAEGKTLQSAVEFAAKASAISVTRIGAQSSIPTRFEVDLF